MNDDLILKSRYRQKKEENDQIVFDRFNELIAIEGAQILEVNKQLMKEFDFLNSDTTIWSIRKRMTKKAKDQKKK